MAVTTSNDMVNIETAIAVRDLLGTSWAQSTGVPLVTRVFDRALGRTVARRFGFRNVQSTEELTAPWFVGAALGLDVLGSFSVAQQTFMVSRLTVEPGSGLVGLAMNELSATTRVVASRGGDDRSPAWFVNLVAHPEVDVSLQGKDSVPMLARVATAQERARLWPLVIAGHQYYADYQLKTDRQIPLVMLEPIG